MSIKGIQDELDIAIFNGDYRDAVKGDSDGYIRGFSQGNMKHKIDVKPESLHDFMNFRTGP